MPTTKLQGYIALAKLRVVELLLVTTVPTMVLAERGWPSTWLVVVTLFGGTLAAAGANAINMVVDRDIDALMARTAGRPLVTGLITPRAALVYAIGLEFLAFGVLWWGANLLSACLTISATLFYVFVYTIWLKRTSRQNIVIGGAAGAVPVLVGWSAVTNSVSWTAVVLFVLMFLWTPPHFWALAIRHVDEYRAAGVPMLPVVVPMEQAIKNMVVYTALLVATSFVLMFLWTPPHFWALAIRHVDEYRAAGVPMLPVVVPMEQAIKNMVVYTALLVATSFVLVPVADLGWIYGITAVLCGIGFLWGTVDLGRRPSPQRSMRVFAYSITYVSVLFGAITVDVLVRYGV